MLFLTDGNPPLFTADKETHVQHSRLCFFARNREVRCSSTATALCLYSCNSSKLSHVQFAERLTVRPVRMTALDWAMTGRQFTISTSSTRSLPLMLSVAASSTWRTHTHTHRGNWMQNRTKGRTQTRGCGGQIDNLASLKIDIVWIFSLGQVRWKLLKACAKTGGILAGAIIEIIPVMLAPLIGWCAQKRPGWLVPYFDSAGSLKPFIHKVEKAGKRFDNYSMWRGLVKHTDINRPFTVLLFISSRLLLSFMKKWRDRYQDVPTLGNCEIKEQRLQHVFKGLWQLFFFLKE